MSDNWYPGRYVGGRIEVVNEFGHGGTIFAAGDKGKIVDSDGGNGECAALCMDDGRRAWAMGYEIKLIDESSSN